MNIPYPSNYTDPYDDTIAQCRECGHWFEAGDISDVDEVTTLDGRPLYQGICDKCAAE